MEDLRITDITPEQLAQLTELAGIVIGEQKSEAYFEWKYLDNPGQRNFGRCVSLDGHVVGSNCSIPLPFQVAGKECLSAQFVDAMVSPVFRRRGVFMTLLEQTIEKMDHAGIQIRFAFPAPVTLQIVKQSLPDWSHVADVPRWICVVDPMRATVESAGGLVRRLYALWLRGIGFWARVSRPRGRGAEATITEDADFDERFDLLWSRVMPGLRVSVNRTAAYLAWRYGRHPEKAYRCFAVTHADGLDAYVVLSETRMQQIPTWELVEFIVAPERLEAGLALLRDVCRRARQAGMAQLSTWMLPHHEDYCQILSQAGFIHSQSRLVPGRFRYTVPLVARVLDEDELSPSPLMASNWYVSMGDSDLH